jgi:HAD superfamily hydrolase (TIGR01490 family)
VSRHLALFDFDGTITRKDTFIEFIRFKAGLVRLAAGLALISPVLVLYKFRVIPNWRAKEIMFGWFFRGMTVTEFRRLGETFATTILPSLIRPSALARIREHQASGHHVFIVTASAEEWIKPWSDPFGITVIATSWEVKDGVLTGKISGRNCYGPEKKVRILERVALADYESIAVYGDTSGDREMLTLGTLRHYRYFKD